MIALRVEDGYGGAVALTLVVEGVVVTVEVAQCADVILDAHDLRDLARVALLAADMLDRATAVTS